MNKYKKALSEIGNIVLDKSGDGYHTKKYLRDFYFIPYGTLQELVNQAESFEWIPVTERLPEEYESNFAKFYGTDQWNNAFWRSKSKEVLVTIEYEDGTRIVASSHTTDGKWSIEKETKLIKFKVVAWSPLPSPYKEENND